MGGGGARGSTEAQTGCGSTAVVERLNVHSHVVLQTHLVVALPPRTHTRAGVRSVKRARPMRPRPPSASAHVAQVEAFLQATAEPRTLRLPSSSTSTSISSSGSSSGQSRGRCPRSEPRPAQEQRPQQVRRTVASIDFARARAPYRQLSPISEHPSCLAASVPTAAFTPPRAPQPPIAEEQLESLVALVPEPLPGLEQPADDYGQAAEQPSGPALPSVAHEDEEPPPPPPPLPAEAAAAAQPAAGTPCTCNARAMHM